MKLLNNLLLLPSEDNSELLSSSPFFSLTENRNHTLISHYILTKVTNTIFFFVRYFSIFFLILHIINIIIYY